MNETKKNSDKDKFCRKCKALLVAGENITQNKLDKSQYICTSCYKAQGKYYRDLYSSGSRWAEYIAKRREEEIDKFSEQWNDPRYAGIKEIADKVYRVWNDFDRKRPEVGIQADWVCEVVFEDMWNPSENGITDDFLDKSSLKRQTKIFARPHILDFVVANREILQIGYREQARNKWRGVVQALNHKYMNKAEICATPRYEDPQTKQSQANWYLLTYPEEQQQREKSKIAKQESLGRRIEYERKLVDIQVKEQEHEQEQKDNNNEEGQNSHE